MSMAQEGIMQVASVSRLDDLEVERIKADAVNIARALASAETYVAEAGAGAGSAALDAAIERVHHAATRLSRLQDHLEALQWDMESAEMDEELVRHGYRRTADELWTSPDGSTGLSQTEAFWQLSDQLDARHGVNP